MCVGLRLRTFGIPYHSAKVMVHQDRLQQWLKYKSGAQELGKNLGPNCKLNMGLSQPARTINGCVGLWNAGRQFSGAQERRSPAFPLTLTTGLQV